MKVPIKIQKWKITDQVDGRSSAFKYINKKIKRQNTQISKYSQYKNTLRITKLSGFVTPQGTKGKAHLYCFAYKKRLHSLYIYIYIYI